MNKYPSLINLFGIIMLFASGNHPKADEYLHDIQFSGGDQLAAGDANTGTAEGEIAYGYFITPKWQLGIRQLLSYGLNNPAEDVWTGSSSGSIKYFSGAMITMINSSPLQECLSGSPIVMSTPPGPQGRLPGFDILYQMRLFC